MFGEPGPRAETALSLPLFLDLRSLTDPVAEVVELGPPDVAPGHGLDASDDGRMDRKCPLDTDTETHFSDRETFPGPTPLAADHDALEDLEPLTIALDHPDVHLQGVAGAEVGDVVAQRAAVDEIGPVHGWGSSGCSRDRVALPERGRGERPCYPDSRLRSRSRISPRGTPRARRHRRRRG